MVTFKLKIVEVDPQGADALVLLNEAAAEARALYPDFIGVGAPWPTNPPTPKGGTYLVAYADSNPVACGAFRPIDDAAVEIRRVFVTHMARGQGLARAILTDLEVRARKLGYAAMRLETGNRQISAVALYESFGFKRIPPFGEYANDPTSICFEKAVRGAMESSA